MSTDDAAPSAGGAAASLVAVASALPEEEAVPVALLEKGVAVVKPEPEALMVLLSLVRPLVWLAEITLVDPDSALDKVLLMAASLLLRLLLADADSS
jgi:hypothetical protein